MLLEITAYLIIDVKIIEWFTATAPEVHNCASQLSR
jgi:hypothetical protein